MIADPRVHGVSVTGSERAGAAVAEIAGRNLKRVVLELGGSDPFILLGTDDLGATVEAAAEARLDNAGQSCNAAKRFIVVDAVYDRFAAAMVRTMGALVVGDPADPTTDVGPLATRAIRDGVADQVARSVAAGARVLCGGRTTEGRGNFYPPTVLGDVPPSAPAGREEVFGPVAALFRVPGIDEAIALANATDFGLGASGWTTDRGEAERLTRDLEAGTVCINDMVASDPRFPFGGIKRSGYGRELSSFGLREFVNVKTVRLQGFD